jgi:hypothetical protein
MVTLSCAPIGGRRHGHGEGLAQCNSAAENGVTHPQLTLIGSLEQKQQTLDRLRKIIA